MRSDICIRLVKQVRQSPRGRVLLLQARLLLLQVVNLVSESLQNTPPPLFPTP